MPKVYLGICGACVEFHRLTHVGGRYDQESSYRMIQHKVRQTKEDCSGSFKEPRYITQFDTRQLAEVEVDFTP